ncbi:MAG TPA: BTAD domain-containing putative transcriptional regulator [Candidatus Limnocylindrales bacterium]|nr:BTAD domain-containing putative transcriptional regulator [Candidatus Limnocylindrales bacterium]
MRILLLGRVTVAVGGHRHAFPRSQARGLFALLALQAGEPVSIAAAIEALWAGNAPQTARTRVHDYASTIRRALLQWGAPDCVDSGRFGYVLRVTRDRVDALELADGLREARSCTDPVKAIARYREALSLWSGEPLADATGSFVDGARIRLSNQYLSGIEAVTELELARGEHAAVAAELAPLATQNPLRERLIGLLMLALHRGGDRPAALALYRRCRAELAEHLGLEPGIDLQRLHQAILAADPALTIQRGTKPQPAQLPYAPATLVGRDRQLAKLDAAAQPGQIVVISGQAGVGKTALAVSWSHAMSSRFPDGQLYVNLHGFSPGVPVAAAEALGGFLRALGVPGEQIPTAEDEAAARLRTELAGARMLMLLDNAVDAGQVRPLLPGGASVTVLVTSRDRLSGLAATHDAAQVALGALDRGDAVGLLSRLLPERRLGTDEAQELAQRCGRLPLALRIAAARLRDEPELTVRGYAAALAGGLGELAIAGDAGTAVRATFDISYSRLDPLQRRVFRLLALVPGGDFDLVAVARLAGLSQPEAREQLASLIAAHLVDTIDDERCALHDVVRAYAAEKAAADETAPGIRAARDRLYGWYLEMARAAAAYTIPELTLLPGPISGVWTDPARARHWLETERRNLVAAATTAADAGLPEYAWRLPDALRGFLWRTARRTDWLSTATAALAAATPSKEPIALATAHLNLGWYHFVYGRDEDALRHYELAAEHAEPAGWVEARIGALAGAARAERDLGRLGAALKHARTTLTLERALGRGAARESVIHALIASICLPAGLLAEALSHAEHAAAADLSPIIKAGHTVIVAEVHLENNEIEQAAALFAEAGQIFEKQGHRAGQAKCATGLGAAAIARQQFPEAARHLDQALTLAREAGDEATEAEASHQLGRLLRRTGRAAEALDHLHRARRLATVPTVRIAALIERSRALEALGRRDEAAEAAGAALHEAGGSEYARLLAEARQLG